MPYWAVEKGWWLPVCLKSCPISSFKGCSESAILRLVSFPIFSPPLKIKLVSAMNIISEATSQLDRSLPTLLSAQLSCQEDTRPGEGPCGKHLPTLWTRTRRPRVTQQPVVRHGAGASSLSSRSKPHVSPDFASLRGVC